MYVIKYGKPFTTSYTIDMELIDKFNKMYPDKRIKTWTCLASTFADQDFIKFLLSEFENSYTLQSDSSLEIIEYDENKGHPILIELTGEDDVNLFNFENGLLWSNEPGVPEYQSLCKSYWYLYDPDYIQSIQTHRIKHDDLEFNVKTTRFVLDGIPKEEFSSAHIDTPIKFNRLLDLRQKYLFGDFNPKTIIKKSFYIEGTQKTENKQKQELELKKHSAQIDSSQIYISFGTSLEEYNSRDISSIKNTQHIKPEGGLWACKYSSTPCEHSEWEKYCRDEEYLIETDYLKKAIKFRLDENSKLFNLETKEDIEYLFSSFGTRKQYPTINFEELSRLYDGIVISEKAQFVLDHYNMVNPETMPKPFCVPGIVIFSKDVVKDVEPFNYELENKVTRTINPNTAAAQLILQEGTLSTIEAVHKEIESTNEGESLDGN